MLISSKWKLSLLIVFTFVICGLFWLWDDQRFAAENQQEIPSLVISLRPERWKSFQARWHSGSVWETFQIFTDSVLKQRNKKSYNLLKLHKWPATDGRKIALDDPRWDRQLFFDPTIQFPRFVTRGEIGCFDSHLRIWRYIVEKNIPFVLIFEDDADINLQRDKDKLEQWILEFHQPAIKDNYDIVFLGYRWECAPLRSVSPHLSEVDFSTYTYYHATHAMLVTQRGAKKLLEHAYPYRLPLDLYIAEQVRHRDLRALQTMPIGSAIGVVPMRSDTQSIH